MARLRRGSTVLETARQRLAGLKAITPAPNFGTNLKVEDYETDINDFSRELDNYNQQIAALDELNNSLEAREDSLRDKNKRFLSATEAQYGGNSSEYEQVGGTRSSDRKRTPRKPSSKGGTGTKV